MPDLNDIIAKMRTAVDALAGYDLSLYNDACGILAELENRQTNEEGDDDA